VTRDKDNGAHPHFHTLMMVPPSWFTRDYVKHDRWVELWRDCLRVNYEPNVDIRTVKSRIEGQSLSEVRRIQLVIATLPPLVCVKNFNRTFIV